MSNQKEDNGALVFIFVIVLIVIGGLGFAAITDSNWIGGAFILGGFYIYNKLMS